MAIPGLTIIGESVNDSVPSTKKLFDENDVAGLLELARSQDEKGAAYIDVNVGLRPPEFMADHKGWRSFEIAIRQMRDREELL